MELSHQEVHRRPARSSLLAALGSISPRLRVPGFWCVCRAGGSWKTLRWVGLVLFWKVTKKVGAGFVQDPGADPRRAA